jgi:hypothetical protein
MKCENYLIYHSMTANKNSVSKSDDDKIKQMLLNRPNEER